jgi:MFS family permease
MATRRFSCQTSRECARGRIGRIDEVLMLFVLRNSWALLLGMMMLLLGNGMQGTLLGVRGSIEGYDATEMSLVMSAYFIGFLAGSRRAPIMIKRVGHVRVFAALASTVSAAFVLYAAAPSPAAWIVIRLIVGFCFAGIYVTAESWLNEASTNETRGKALSLYMIVQMLGIISAQALLTLGDASGYSLFVVMSVLVSISFLPILLTVSAAPAFDRTKPMTLRQLFAISPLGCVGTFLLGGVFAAIFAMASVYGTEKGLSVNQIALFVGVIYFGGLIALFPIGWLSDRSDRRKLIMALTLFGAAFAIGGVVFADDFAVVLLVGLVLGAVANPLYSLLIAYTNDFLDQSDMAAASGGLLFINGLGAISGPLLIGWLMTAFGPDAFFGFVGLLFALIAVYAGYRMTVRATPTDTSPYAVVLPQASAVALGAAQEAALERAGAAEAAAR